MSGDPIIEIWCTTYALTEGISRHMAKHCVSISEVMVKYSEHGFAHGEGKEWHRTAAGALARAEEMRAAKIKSLHKQIAKLEKMEFKAP